MYETVIGLETHVQLSTASKAFCADAAAFGGAPNTHTSIVSLAHPGTLPRLNRRAVEYAVRLGLALDCSINVRSAFDRKNYFYADLPKGFQTTQDRSPICIGGHFVLQNPGGDSRVIRLHHIHLEEDAGKSIHDQDPRESLLDLNRAGVPLLEIVSEPDFRSADEVAAYMEELRRLVRWLGVSDGNMEEGSMRCDVNISVRRQGETRFGNRCEIKNVNSMRFAKRAIEYEVKRQIQIVESGGSVEQETRGFDADAGKTFSLREKENAHDYRYFPEPDLPPVVLSEAILEKIKSEMPLLPRALEQDFQARLGLPAYDAQLLTQEKETAEYFLRLAELRPAAKDQKAVSNLIINKLLPWSAAAGMPLAECPVPLAGWVEFLYLVENGQLSASTANQRLFPALLERPGVSPGQLAAELNLLQSADSGFLEKLVDDTLARFPEKVAEYRKGKRGLLGFFMGEVMKASKGKAEPQATQKLLEERLSTK
jgi:aspartyl-tRNA(Asn)/glutamyl-tRNA(Gln) amidotransferase subunit B